MQFEELKLVDENLLKFENFFKRVEPKSLEYEWNFKLGEFEYSEELIELLKNGLELESLDYGSSYEPPKQLSTDDIMSRVKKEISHKIPSALPSSGSPLLSKNQLVPIVTSSDLGEKETIKDDPKKKEDVGINVEDLTEKEKDELLDSFGKINASVITILIEKIELLLIEYEIYLEKHPDQDPSILLTQENIDEILRILKTESLYSQEKKKNKDFLCFLLLYITRHDKKQKASEPDKPYWEHEDQDIVKQFVFDPQESSIPKNILTPTIAIDFAADYNTINPNGDVKKWYFYRGVYVIITLDELIYISSDFFDPEIILSKILFSERQGLESYQYFDYWGQQKREGAMIQEVRLPNCYSRDDEQIDIVVDSVSFIENNSYSQPINAIGIMISTNAGIFYLGNPKYVTNTQSNVLTNTNRIDIPCSFNLNYISDFDFSKNLHTLRNYLNFNMIALIPSLTPLSKEKILQKGNEGELKYPALSDKPEE